MKRKIFAVLLVTVLCLTALSVTALAADSLKKVPSTIPDTDIAYNRVEKVTVKIPGTDVTFDLAGVSDQVGLVYEDGVPLYIFAFYEPGTLTFNNSGKYDDGRTGAYSNENGKNCLFGEGYSDNAMHTGLSIDFTESEFDNKCFYKEIATNICKDNSCIDSWDRQEDEEKREIVAGVEFRAGQGGNDDDGDGGWLPYDLMSYAYDEEDDDYNVIIPAEIEKFDISKIAVVDGEKPQYSITKGANSVWDASSSNGLTITADGDFTKFTGVKIDNITLNPANYEAKSGSTVVTLEASFLQTLKSGKHTVTIVYTDGEVSTQIEIKGTKAPSDSQNVDIPNTGTKSTIAFAPIAICLSLALLFMEYKIKNRRKQHS